MFAASRDATSPKLTKKSTEDLEGHRCKVGLSGLEPPTSPLSGVRSNQLSYKPEGFPQARERKSIPALTASPSL